jgi:hypothetical protein
MTVPYVFKNATGTIPLSQLDDNFTAVVDKATLAGTSGATSIGITPAGTISATTVAGALNELDTEKATTASVALKANISNLAASTGAATVGFTPSGTMVATNVQTAITELSTSFVPTSASAVGFTPTGTITATNVQGAIVEINTDLAAPTGASTVGFAPTGTIAATTVQTAIAEINTDLALSTGAALVGFAPTGTIAATTVQTAIAEINTDLALSTGAALVGFAPIGTIAATTVQTAIEEINTDLALSTGSTLVGNIQPGTGAVARTVNAKLRETVSVKDFGAVGNGIANDTTAINNAILAVNAQGSVKLYFPAGIYRYQGGGWLGDGVVITGDGRNATIIRSIIASPTSGYLFSCGGYGAGIQDVRFDAVGTSQTGGCYVWLQGAESFIDNFYMTGDYNGVLMTGNVSRIRHGRFQNGASGAIRIRAEGGDNSQSIDDVLMGAQTPQISFAGIRVRNSSALMITNTSVIQQGHGLLIDPTTATTSANTADGSVFSLYVNNCFFDNNSGNGIRIVPTGNSSVVRCRFANVWASSSNSDGILIQNSSSATISGMHFESPHILLNTGSGVSLGGTLSDIAINGGEICNNSYGVYVNNTVTNLRIIGATIGSGAGLSGNTNSGVAFGTGTSASDYIAIANNVMRNNGAVAIVSSSVSGVNLSIYSNIGYKNSYRGVATFPSGSSSLVVTHGLSVTPGQGDFLISPTVNVTAGGVTQYWVSSANSTTFTISVNATVTATLYFVWDVKTAGA